MIRLTGLSHVYRNGTPVLANVSIDLPGDRRLAVLGREHAGKTTLVHLLSGLIMPTRGNVERFGRLSFPAGYQRGFRLANSGRQNVLFAARIYGADPDEVLAFVDAVAGFGEMLEKPLRDWSVQNRFSLSYVLAYALPFDTYLFDNMIGPGQPEIRDVCRQLFDARTKSAGAIVATRNVRIAEQLCDCAVVMRDHGLVFYDDMREAIAQFEADAPQVEQAPAEVRTAMPAEGAL